MTSPDLDPNAQEARPEPVVERRVPVAPEAEPEQARSAGLYDTPPDSPVPQADLVAAPEPLDPPHPAEPAEAIAAPEPEAPASPPTQADAAQSLDPELQETLPVSIQEPMVSLQAENHRLRTEIHALEQALKKALS